MATLSGIAIELRKLQKPLIQSYKINRVVKNRLQCAFERDRTSNLLVELNRDPHQDAFTMLVIST